MIVFSCFDEPIQKLARAFGSCRPSSLTGKTPLGEAPGASWIAFSRTTNVRVFLANIIAGGIGHHPDGGDQVVFNDLDWVPANHWQAEDRAYRIGQTRTVNVTYLVGEDTIDEFVQAVLETKAALVARGRRRRGACG